jgi:hypothetical protein
METPDSIKTTSTAEQATRRLDPGDAPLLHVTCSPQATRMIRHLFGNQALSALDGEAPPATPESLANLRRRLIGTLRREGVPEGVVRAVDASVSCYDDDTGFGATINLYRCIVTFDGSTTGSVKNPPGSLEFPDQLRCSIGDPDIDRHASDAITALRRAVHVARFGSAVTFDEYASEFTVVESEFDQLTRVLTAAGVSEDYLDAVIVTGKFVSLGNRDRCRRVVRDDFDRVVSRIRSISGDGRR